MRLRRWPVGNPLPDLCHGPKDNTLNIAFICSPAASGIRRPHHDVPDYRERLRQAGHDCTVYLYDLHGSASFETHRYHPRGLGARWPWMKAVTSGVGLDFVMPAIFATSWETAYVLPPTVDEPRSQLLSRSGL